ncbi:MAG: outer membrane beta-barrel protein [Fimbriimonas sp.]
MRNLITTMVGAALVFGAAVPAFAQQKPLGLSGRIGFFLPSDRGTRNNSDDAWFAMGVDYKIRDMPSTVEGRLSSLSLSLDYAAKEDYRSLPILVNYQVRQNEFYFFGGLGLNFARVDRGVLGTDSDTTFAYQLGLGYDFQTAGSTPLFVEAKFMGNEKSELNGFGLFAGVRF